MKILKYLFLFLVVCHFSIYAKFTDPSVVYLTWEHSPQTTMTIQWITSVKEPSEPFVEYIESGHRSVKTVKASRYSFPDESPYFLFRAELKNLTPNTEYAFKIVPGTELYKFKTLPETLDSPLKFVVGGDIYRNSLDYVMEMNKAAALTSPAFAIVGGDLAYTVSKIDGFFQNIFFQESFDRWHQWLRAWYIQMVTPEGLMIPIVPTIGNHDLLSGEKFNLEKSPYFYFLFNLSGYRVIDVADYMSIFILDSGHSHPIAGQQTSWLEKALSSRQEVPHKFAVYHVGAFPSVRAFDTKDSELVRKNWVPLFEKFGLHTAFEHHDHAFKRTYPILQEKIDPDGVMYMGDGCWGIDDPRIPQNRWYLAAAAASRHVILVTIDQNKRVYHAIDHRNRVIDECVQEVREPINLELTKK